MALFNFSSSILSYSSRCHMFNWTWRSLIKNLTRRSIYIDLLQKYDHISLCKLVVSSFLNTCLELKSLFKIIEHLTRVLSRFVHNGINPDWTNPCYIFIFSGLWRVSGLDVRTF